MPGTNRKHPYALGVLIAVSTCYYSVIGSSQSQAITQTQDLQIGPAESEPITLFVAYAGICCIFLIGLIRAIRIHLTSRRLALGFAKSNCRPQSFDLGHGDCLPRFVILVPARDESRVIRNTIDRLARLDYPKDRYEVVIITDQREHGPFDKTTKAIACKAGDALNKLHETNLFTIIEVPTDFNGNLRTEFQPSLKSTKGRALNYALQWLTKAEKLASFSFVGVLDADGRLHPRALLNAAAVAINENADVIQGPVFQVSNLDRADVVGVMAGVELSIHHLSRMWRDLKSKRSFPRFLAGTNYFIKPSLLQETGGWNSNSLVEDADLGLHLFLTKKARAKWLPAYEVEQTPPTWRIYLRQRERWALGHLQLLPIVFRSKLDAISKARVYMKILLHFIESPLDIILPLASWHIINSLQGMHSPGIASSIILIFSIYTWGYLGRGLILLNQFSAKPLDRWHLCRSFILLTFCIPALALLQLIPRLTALFKFCFARQQEDWYKTERSNEVAEATLCHE